MAQLGSQSDPGTDLLPITPSDTVDLEPVARAMRCRPDGTAGTLRFISLRGVERNTFISAGEVLQVGATRVFATGTTATGLEAII
ncbi:MAG: hypothetical protein AAFN44_03465 [Pseudomonadota bacterium]